MIVLRGFVRTTHLMNARILILLFVAAATSCSRRIESCNDGKPHQWGKWSDVWMSPSAAGVMQQTRSCEKCGVAQVGLHH
jgi:hypothetical protein